MASTHSVGCAALGISPTPPDPIPAAFSQTHPIGFANHTLGNDAIVRITTPHVACSGTLIAEDLVLTAHHCVVEQDQLGAYLPTQVEPSRINVELGGDYLPWGEIGARAIVVPPCGHASGNGDIAIIVLDTQLVDVPTLEVSLMDIPSVGTVIEPVGFGRCADSGDGIRRRSRERATIQSVLPTAFQTNSAICPGDSGGPAISRNVVVGVISRSAMDEREATSSRTEFTRVDRWEGVFANAYRISSGQSRAEQPPVGGCSEQVAR